MPYWRTFRMSHSEHKLYEDTISEFWKVNYFHICLWWSHPLLAIGRNSGLMCICPGTERGHSFSLLC